MDPLDDLLRPVESARPDAVAKAHLGERTTREVRRQRRRRRLNSVASLIGAYAAGILTVFAVQAPDRAALPVALKRPIETQMQPTINTIADLEWKALEEPDRAAVLYRAAGDRYLTDIDPANAIRCYGNVLDAAPAEANEVKDDDNWLLMSIKLARRKEANQCEQ